MRGRFFLPTALTLPRLPLIPPRPAWSHPTPGAPKKPKAATQRLAGAPYASGAHATCLQRTASSVFLERFIEFGTRRKLLGPGGLPYSREEDGGLVVFLPEKTGRFRLSRPGIGARTEVLVTAFGDVGGKQLLRVNVALTWHAAAKEWALYHLHGTDEVSEGLWQVLEVAAKQVGWSLPRKADHADTRTKDILNQD
jgi:hypothetical protein